jgi:maleylacetate reductase
VADSEPLRFDYATHAVRVVFGAGSLVGLPESLANLGLPRVVLITTPGRTRDVPALLSLLGKQLVEVFSSAAPQVPVDIVRDAVAVVDRIQPDGCVSLGGGSAIGLGKAIARATGLPLAAVPTTYSGSEMTAIWGITEGSEKQTGRDPRVAPRLVLYDPDLTLDLPPDVSAASGMNAIAHCVEAMYAPDASPVSSLLAEDGLRRLAASLPQVVRSPRDLVARGEALAGAHLAGRVLDVTAMGLHHKLCHVLGGSFGLPHAGTHAALLPYVVAFNTPAAPAALGRVAEVLGAADAAVGLRELGRRMGTPTLAELGFNAADVPRAAEMAVAGSYPNPRRVTEAEVRDVLQRALADDVATID